MRERDELRERRRERRGGGRRYGRGPADGARAAPPQPGVEARNVEPVPALGHHAQHLAVPVLAEADGAHGVGVGGPAGERDLGVRRDGGRVEPDGGAGRRGCGGVSHVVRGLGPLRDEEHARDGDGEVAGARGRGGGLPGPVVPAAAAEAEVGGEQERGEQDEEAERDGDGVAEAEVGERGEEGHRGRAGGGDGGGESLVAWERRNGIGGACARRAVVVVDAPPRVTWVESKAAWGGAVGAPVE